MIAKHKMLGLAVMVGGAVMTYALFSQTKPSTNPKQTPIVDNETVVRPVATPLTADINTETKILTEKQKEREAQVRAQEAQTKTLLAEQERIKELALQKAQAEVVENLVVKTRPEVEAMQQAAEQKRLEEKKQQAQKAREQADEQTKKQANETLLTTNKKEALKKEDKKQEQTLVKDKQQQDDKAAKKSRHTVKAGDTLIRLSREYGVPVSAIAAANNMARHDTLRRGTTIKIPSATEIKALEIKAKEEEKKRAEKQQQEQKARSINQKLSDARKEAKKQGINDGYGVQVALADNKAKADALVSKYRKAGYKVKTIEDARGVRVVVGPERSQAAAMALKEKINNDPNVEKNGAWVLLMK